MGAGQQGRQPQAGYEAGKCRQGRVGQPEAGRMTFNRAQAVLGGSVLRTSPDLF